ncbi:MAG: hypothetical protein LUQ50_13545 [Methanospirillum sp.]|uniref:hypothetical protein n=1 Tax=Methanospirillum sp. TaxID=45200 RepID=UPI002369B5DE|nr:hypothetical protein [Methanospirillum sp.]MDD1730080.1 hypothetical protein [Methanospirillum sp.]
MKKDCVAVGLVCLILAGLAGADYLATSVSTDGSVMLATSGSDQNGSFVSRVMGVDAVRLVRAVSGGEEMATDLIIKGSGPILASDYASSKGIPVMMDEIACTFLTDSRVQAGKESDLYTVGMLQNGSYEISRVVGSGLTGGTVVNGSSMVGFGSQTNGNTTQKTRGFVAGNLSLNDLVRYGGRL